MENPSLQIVIVEDDKSIRDLFLASPDAYKMKANIRVFENGIQLINYINNPKVIPDVVFLKLHLPLQNGMRCLKAIRQQKMMNRALLVFYSPKATESEIEEAFVERANIYMNAPTDSTSLDHKIEKILKLAFQYKHSNLNVENLLGRL